MPLSTTIIQLYKQKKSGFHHFLKKNKKSALQLTMLYLLRNFRMQHIHDAAS
jgi:hypothetical protein